MVQRSQVPCPKPQARIWTRWPRCLRKTRQPKYTFRVSTFVVPWREQTAMSCRPCGALEVARTFSDIPRRDRGKDLRASVHRREAGPCRVHQLLELLRTTHVEAKPSAFCRLARGETAGPGAATLNPRPWPKQMRSFAVMAF